MTEPVVRCVSCGGTRLATEPPCTCRLTGDYTPPTWDAGVMPTPVELLTYVRAARNDEVLLLLDGLLSSSEAAHRCMTADHDAGMHELATLRLNATRWAILRDHHTARRAGNPNRDPISTIAKLDQLIAQDNTP